MGNACSSRRRDKDNASSHSEEYVLVTRRKSSQDSRLYEKCPSVKNTLQSGIILQTGSTVASVSLPEGESHAALNQPGPKKNGSAFVPPHKSGKPPRSVLTSQDTTPDRNLCLPEDINDLADTHKQLLLGVIPVSKPTLKAKKIVIYICAADSDECHAEKNIFHANVYPEVRQVCKEEGYELHVVDLHWRSALEERRDHKFPELCLYELHRQSDTSHIVPVIFLNNSLGTALIPKTFDCEDYENTLQLTKNKEVLKKWYKLDKEAQPQRYLLQSAEQHIPNFDSNNEAEKKKALTDWNNEVENILEILVSCFNEELCDTYLTTTVEQEIQNTIRMSTAMARHSVWVHRISKSEDPNEDTKCLVSKENKRRLDLLLTELKNNLFEKNIIQLEDTNQEEQIKNQLLPHFLSVIRSVIVDDRLKRDAQLCFFGVDRRLLQELMIQTNFCRKAAAAHSIGNRLKTVNKLKNYMLSEENNGIMVVRGLPGCGKTTILARFLVNCYSLLPNLAIVFRFVNASVESSSLELLLHSILEQINYVITGKGAWETHSMSKYAELFPKMLSMASENRPVLVVIDGLDQFHEPISNIDWIPLLLPRNIKFIFSISASASILPDIEEKLRDSLVFVEVPTLREEESEMVFNTLVAELDSISPLQVPARIRSKVRQNLLPFHLKIIAQQYSWFRNETMAIYPKSEIDRQINHMLDVMEAILGKSQVELITALLLTARYGLTDSELLDILSYEDCFHSDSYPIMWAGACIFVTEFTKYMRSFLKWFYTSDGIAVYIKHELMRTTLQQRYKYKLGHARQLLHKYFTGSLWDSTEKISSARVIGQPIKYKNRYNTRKLEELPYHEFQLNDTLQKLYLEDHIWVFSKVCGCSVFQVLEDVKLETQSRPDGDTNLTLIQNFLEKYSPALNYDGRQFYSQLLKCLSEHKNKALSNASNFISSIEALVLKPPVFSLLPYSDCIRDLADDVEGQGNEKQPEGYQFDVIKRIEFVSNLIVIVSTSMQEVSVWDVTNGQLVRKLINVPQPMGLEMIDAFRCIVLCNRELRMYDLNTGELVSKLKGVMNQKMPYFGLHDSSHLVALSRNRMYVNLMNLESGDLVTSFKAGEDRFLNSLLVSGNGKILVCGDETQKPFPLLVWNLASRKLLYDLRITHHDFITRLAAITYEGNYVCCVAKEVDEPSPNFIVVYDLQSGTMFKKWKPGVNCVSLDISSKDACVLSGHQNGTISIWDLITGACKWTLVGHTAPVMRLRLDALGGAFLSIDTTGRDRSIRLWNLTNGQLTAVYTANKTITAAEILSGGKYVVIGMEGTSLLTILHLAGPTCDTFCLERKSVSDYGKADNYGKIFDLEASSPINR